VLVSGCLQRVLDGRRREDGGALVMVVLFLPVLILFVVFVVDVGNWFVH
jgi:Flp pilus assembly protein TadG